MLRGTEVDRRVAVEGSGEWCVRVDSRREKFFQNFPGIQTRFDDRFAIRVIEDARATLAGIGRAATPEVAMGQ